MNSISSKLKGAALRFSCGDVVIVKKSGSKISIVDIAQDGRGFIYYIGDDNKPYNCNQIKRA